jgi:hypothetical protein
MKDEDIDQIEFWLRVDSEKNFAVAIFGPDRVEQIENSIRNQMAQEGMEVLDTKGLAAQGMTDLGPTYSMYGGELAKRMIERLREMNQGKLNEFQKTIQSRICPIYLKIKNDGILDGEPVKIAVAVCDGLASLALTFPAPIPRVAAYLIRYKALENWCCRPA